MAFLADASNIPANPYYIEENPTFPVNFNHCAFPMTQVFRAFVEKRPGSIHRTVYAVKRRNAIIRHSRKCRRNHVDSVT